MKNIIAKVFFDKNSKLSVLTVLCVFMLIGLGCFGGGRSKSTTPIPSEYYGDWVGQDGATLSIRADGTGDYHAGGTKVDGGTAEIDNDKKTLSITFFGIGKTLHIDEAPSGDKMKLDNVIFRRSGGFSTTSSDNTPTTSSSPNSKNPFSSSDNTATSNDSADRTPQDGTPSNNEVETLVKETMADFAGAVDQGDFDDFRQNTSKAFQSTYNTTQLNTNFQVFIDKRDLVMPSFRGIDSTTANFSSPPHLRTEKGFKILVADGSFPTSPRPVSFETEYVLEKGNWKLLVIKVKV